ncbi:MAG: transcription antitermination factor NusB [Spirochaetales bacterium]|nr:transcription antitermination factor NusB [Spirochaetales bacterium]
MEHRHKARELAFKALYSLELNKFTYFSDIITIEEDLLNKDINSEFGEELFNGVKENIPEIDAILKSKLEHWDIERVEKVDLAILRLSIYSLLYLKEIPRNITIDEAIKLSKIFSSDKSYMFINGILDSIL